MIEVKLCFLCFSTVFHTLDTQGQVVSTMWHPRSLSSCISCTVAPKAGRITTSPLATSEKSFTPPSTGMNCTFMSRRWSFTEGLWMISLVIQMRSLG